MKFIDKLYSVKNVKGWKQDVRILGVRFRRNCLPRDLKLYRHLPIQTNKIVFYSTMNGYSCNPKYITEEILRRKLPYDLVWVVSRQIFKHLDSYPAGVRLVVNGSEAAIKEYATAKMWIENFTRPEIIKKGLFKRPSQIVLQTWHGSMGIKAIAADRHNLPSYTIKLNELVCREIDYTISHSDWETERFKSFFYNHGKTCELGHPRNDILFSNDRQSIRSKVCQKLGIPQEKKILLYVPTWRDDKNLDWMSLDYGAVTQACKKRFGGEWVLMARMHHYMFQYGKKFHSAETEVFNASEYSDAQELLVAADACITDYSSAIFDFCLTRRPGFIYAPDREVYENTRGLYYPLSETPFPVAENNASLTHNIESFNEEAYVARVNEFVKGKGCIDDGNASARVVDLIQKLMTDNNP